MKNHQICKKKLRGINSALFNLPKTHFSVDFLGTEESVTTYLKKKFGSENITILSFDIIICQVLFKFGEKGSKDHAAEKLKKSCTSNIIICKMIGATLIAIFFQLGLYILVSTFFFNSMIVIIKWAKNEKK